MKPSKTILHESIFIAYELELSSYLIIEKSSSTFHLICSIPRTEMATFFHHSSYFISFIIAFSQPWSVLQIFFVPFLLRFSWYLLLTFGIIQKQDHIYHGKIHAILQHVFMPSFLIKISLTDSVTETLLSLLYFFTSCGRNKRNIVK